MSPGSQRKVARAGRESVLAVEKLLRESLVGDKPAQIEECLRSALNSQSLLAKYSNELFLIHGCSLNTFKAIANAVVPGGFKSVDRLRTTLLRACQVRPDIDSESVAQLPRVARLQIKLDEARRDNISLREDLLLVMWVLRKSMAYARSYAHDGGNAALRDRWARQQRELAAMLASRPSVGTANDQTS